MRPDAPAASVSNVLEGILLSGSLNGLATEAFRNMPAVGVGPEAIVGGVILTRLDVHLAPGATVQQVNAALRQVGGGVVSMLHGFPGVTIAVPRQTDVEALQALADALSQLPRTLHVSIGHEKVAAVLPERLGGFDVDKMSQLLPTRFPAAWNARRLATKGSLSIAPRR
jgi:hypothetical protein